jgi:hypothetical protein
VGLDRGPVGVGELLAEEPFEFLGGGTAARVYRHS